MYFYPFHIGDFRSGAANLSRHARWIYRDMMDVYYDTEKPFPLDIDLICDLIGVESDAEKKMVEKILRLKFQETQDGYVNAKCDDVIAEYHSKAETARENGRKGGRPKKPIGLQSGSNQDASGNPEQTGSQANHKPITNNHNTPIPPKGAKRSAIALKTYLSECKESGCKPIPEDHKVFEYADKIGIPHDFLRLQWVEFKNRYSMDGAKRYKEWPTVFHKSVIGNWFKIWYMKNGSYELSTVGEQAKRSAE